MQSRFVIVPAVVRENDSFQTGNCCMPLQFAGAVDDNQDTVKAEEIYLVNREPQQNAKK